MRQDPLYDPGEPETGDALDRILDSKAPSGKKREGVLGIAEQEEGHL